MANNPKHKENLKRPWQKGESGNKNGRPKKLISTVLHDLKQQGYEKLTAKEVHEMYEMMLTLPQGELRAMMTADDTPMIQKVIIKSLVSGKGFDVLETMLSRLYGKPKQAVDNNMVGAVTLNVKLND